MSSFIIDLLSDSGHFAIIVSILINVLISVAGVIPSFFVTAANITVFGFQTGLLISYLGECTGAVVSFWLYRKGISTLNTNFLNKNNWLLKLQKAQGGNAFLIILILRLLPFVPSGMINLASALSKTSFIIFFVASSIGKLPALIIEAYSAKVALDSSKCQIAVLLLLVLIFFIFYYFRKRSKQ